MIFEQSIFLCLVFRNRIWHKQRECELLSLKIEIGFSIDSGVEMVYGVGCGVC